MRESRLISSSVTILMMGRSEEIVITSMHPKKTLAIRILKICFGETKNNSLNSEMIILIFFNMVNWCYEGVGTWGTDIIILSLIADCKQLRSSFLKFRIIQELSPVK
jgi:hypothetical protein